MGIESDQLVFDYLSRVGDLAQQRQLPSGTRMRLVSELRSEIDRRRAGATADSPAAVRRILDRIGTPESVVADTGVGDGGQRGGGAAGTSTGAGGRGGSGGGADKGTGSGSGGGRRAGGGRDAPSGRGAVPSRRAAESGDVRPKRLRRVVPRPRPAEPETTGAAGPVPSPPHLASTEELGSGAQPDWWRVESGPFGATDSVPGFVGGVEIPELFEPPPLDEELGTSDGKGPGPKATGTGTAAARTRPGPEPVAAVGPAEPVEAAGAGAGGRVWRRFVPRLRPVGGGWSNPLLLLAAALLVAGAVVGSLVLLGLGWLIAYLSRRLSPGESKWAVLGVPGAVAAAWVVWLWGRTEGRWGEPLVQEEMGDAVAETWPAVLRGAAIASAVFLVWRSQRRR